MDKGTSQKEVPLREDVDHLLDLARMLIELGDVQLTSQNCTAALFALCYMTNKSPRQMAEDIFKGLPDDEEWTEKVLPHILDYPEEYEPLTGDE